MENLFLQVVEPVETMRNNPLFKGGKKISSTVDKTI